MNDIQIIGDRAVIKLKDTLDYTSAFSIIEEIKPVIAQGILYIDFDCGNLKFVSNEGIRGLIFIKQKIDENNTVTVAMQNVSKSVKNVLILSGIEGYVDFIG